MTSRKNIYRISGVLSLLGLAGCVPPDVTIHAAPEPTPQEVAIIHNNQIRIIPVAYDSVFPKALEILMDNGYLVRSVNEKMGIISFYQQWRDMNQSGASIVQEGSVFFKPTGTSSTQARLLLTGSWQRVESSGGGIHSSGTNALVGQVQQNAQPEEYKKLLDLFEKGLSTGPELSKSSK